MHMPTIQLCNKICLNRYLMTSYAIIQPKFQEIIVKLKYVYLGSTALEELAALQTKLGGLPSHVPGPNPLYGSDGSSNPEFIHVHRLPTTVLHVNLKKHLGAVLNLTYPGLPQQVDWPGPFLQRTYKVVGKGDDQKQSLDEDVWELE